MTEKDTAVPFHISATLSNRIKNIKLHAERERYRVRPRRSPRGHKTTRDHEREWLRFWRAKTRGGFFLLQVGERYYRVTRKGYLVQELKAAYESESNSSA